jgi:16S rRNA (uracil1498-N3)-methyltransferase
VIARVLVPAAAREGDVLDVPADEAGHLVRVLRLGPGAAVRVFDGRGLEWDATLRATTKQGAVVELGAARDAAPEPRVRYTLAVAVLKGDGTDDVVRDAVMMGVQAIRPFVSARTEVRAASLERAHRRERWERVAIASAKQCGRAVLPVIHDVVDFTAMLGHDGDALRLLLVEPAVAVTAARLRDLSAPQAVSLAIGPEGGWTAEEAERAVAAGWQPLTLGARVLRAEAAPLAALAACQAVWSDT